MTLIQPIADRHAACRLVARSAAALALLAAGAAAQAEPVATPAPIAAATESDAQFRALFNDERPQVTVISVPARQPVAELRFTSNFGFRSDPFNGSARMHAGVDIPGPLGTPIYATADGIVQRAERAGGYGNLVELNHGKGIETRYGHLSRITVAANTRVRRGQLIGMMGSTGRSTGSHLHYEVRVDGKPVNPVPFLQQAGYDLDRIEEHDAGTDIAMGGPED